LARNVFASTIIVINEHEEILLILHPQRGWEMPQGRVEEGESFQQAAVREVKEETGVDIELIKFCGVFQNIDRGVCNLIFLGKPVGGELATSIESLEVGYFPLEEGLNKVTWGNFRERIELALMEEQQPFLVEFFEKNIV
jgi:8-oxo-dGTP diphosphatase